MLEALKKEESFEAIVLIRCIYKSKGDAEKFAYWDEVFQKSDRDRNYMKDKWPEYLGWGILFLKEQGVDCRKIRKQHKRNQGHYSKVI